MPTTSRTEAFLTDFHNAHPGLTAEVFGALPVVFRGSTFPSSYDVLAAVVPGSGVPIQVLDLACGDGFLLAKLAARVEPGLALSGVDMNAAELNLARTHLPPVVVLQQAKAQALPFLPETFDYVLCHLAIMLMDDIEHVMLEVRRVMKPGAVFAAIVGAPPPPSAAFTAYVDALTRHPLQGEHAGFRLGDRRFRHPDGIREVLSLAFHHVAIEEIHIPRRLTPDELWRWYLSMYDLHLRSETGQREIEREFKAAAAPLCGADGRLDCSETLRCVSALA